MSATIGAALKKIAVALLTDKKVIKTIGGIIIGIIIIMVMPIIAVVSVFNGSMDLDTDKLNQSIQENISAEQMENLQLINDTMTEVENQLKSKNCPTATRRQRLSICSHCPINQRMRTL